MKNVTFIPKDLLQYMYKIGKDGHQLRFMFPNHRGASLVDDGYGRDAGKFEIAVMDSNFDLDYDTPLTGDVLGYLDKQEVITTLYAIKGLSESDYSIQQDSLDRAMSKPLIPHQRRSDVS